MWLTLDPKINGPCYYMPSKYQINVMHLNVICATSVEKVSLFVTIMTSSLILDFFLLKQQHEYDN